jgi:outer membrane receptor protein involved in Fe transport
VNLIDQLVALEEESQPTPLCGGGTVQCVVFTNTSGRMFAVGGEAQLRWRPSRFTMLDATYSFVWLGGADITGGAYPAHLASIRGIVPIKDGLLRLSAQGVFQSARRAQDGSMTGEAFLLNAGFSGEYSFIRYFAGVQNILDQRPVVPVLSEINFSKVPQYGRTFYVELAASF